LDLYRIKELCLRNDLTIAALEKQTGLSNGTISKWKECSPRADNLKCIADYFGVTMDYLMTGREEADA